MYVHIPFCRHVCAFCCYNRGRQLVRHQDLDPYCEALLREAAGVGQRPALAGVQTDALYIGGGTPTTLESRALRSLVHILRDNFRLRSDVQVTVESSPSETTPEKMEALLDAGVSRLSLGVQSLNSSILRRLASGHTPDQAHRAFLTARAAGFNNINVDLLYRLPGQSVDTWLSTLRSVLAWNPDHISIYPLGVVPGTPLSRMLREGRAAALPSLQDERSMLEAALESLREAGYQQYSLDEFARPGKENLYTVHSRRGNLIALGAGAYGVLNGFLYKNAESPEEYVRKVNTFGHSVAAGLKLSSTEMAARFLAVSVYYLGFSRSEFREEFGRVVDQAYAPTFDALINRGLIEEQGDRLILTVEGRFFAPDVSRAFYSEEQLELCRRAEEFLSVPVETDPLPASGTFR